jgi:hypothetical protein
MSPCTRLLAGVWPAAVLVACSAESPKVGMVSSAETCVRSCLAKPAGSSPMFQAWDACLASACGDLPTGSLEWQGCVTENMRQDNPQAKCSEETAACFSGAIDGCKELVDEAERSCQPTTLPIPQSDLERVGFCVVRTGWRASIEAQRKAFPLWYCAYYEADNCQTACLNGAAACRACAQTKCGGLYDGCMADSKAPAADGPMPAEKADCQTTTRCVLGCLNPAAGS